MLWIDLTDDWTSESVTLHSIPKPPAVPNLRYGGIWVDRKAGRLYTGFAGTEPYFGSPGPAARGLWSFTPDDSGGGSWKSLNKTADASFTDEPRPFRGGVASGHDVGYFLGGMPGPAHRICHPALTCTSEGFTGNDSGPQQPLSNFISYDFSSGTATSSSVWGPASNEGPGLSGGMVYVPNFGNKGVLINMGGYHDRSRDDGLTRFQTVQVYDIDSQRWFGQLTSGTVPRSRKDFCIAGAPSRKQTFEILIYAGWGGKLGHSAVVYDSAFVLTLPGFYWVRAHYLPRHPRHGLTCNAVGGGQILAIGGVDSTQKDDVNGSYAGGFNTPDPFTQGLAIFDLGELAWSSAYSKRRGPHNPPAKIQRYYDRK